jgi:lipopolysaccharide transport system permease protein
MMLKAFKDALADMRDGLRLRRVWMALAHEDIGDHHRRTTLGPFWLLLNYLAFAGSFIFLIRRGDGGDYNYPAFVATGLFAWFFIMDVITASTSLFLREEGFIKGTTLPLSVYIMRLFMQSVIRASYALLGCLIILLFSGLEITLIWLWSTLGIAIILFAVPPAIILFAFLGAFFPDSQFLVSNLMRIGMFLTPVFWTPEESGGFRHFFYYWNPFTYFLEIIRFPILWGTVHVDAFLISLAIGLSLWVVALLLLGRLRRQVVFVL